MPPPNPPIPPEPHDTWIRLEASIIFDDEAIAADEVLAGQISEDILAYLRTVTLSQITLRYWYTEEGTDGVTVATTPIAQQASCDFAAITGGCTNVTMSFVQVSPASTDL